MNPIGRRDRWIKETGRASQGGYRFLLLCFNIGRTFMLGWMVGMNASSA